MSDKAFRNLLVAAIGIIYIAVFFSLDRWKTTLYHGDSSHYYLHVVSFFVNGDVGDYDKTITSLLETNPTSIDARQDEFGIRLTDKGKRYIKYTLGVPLFETPFFLLAHAYASISKTYPANGWSRPYLFAIGLAPIFYICLGFWLLTGMLQRHFSRIVSALTVMAIAIATNLLYQGTYVVMAHAFLFFAYCLLIHLSVRFYNVPSKFHAMAIGLTAGLITLTRVPELICIVIPLLWGVTGVGKLKERIGFGRRNPTYLVLAGAGLLLVFSLQMAYWYFVSGNLLFDPYQGEGIDLLNPKLHKGWFDFSNGWLIYTPIMWFALLGLFMMKRKSKDALLPILLFVIPHAYIHYSYYAWTYFPGLGQRPMVETYPLMAFSLAAFFALCLNAKWLKWLPLAAILFFGWLNIFQTWQSNEGIIWSERANKPFYFATFGKTSSSKKSFRAYDTNAAQPDTSDIEYKATLLLENFESYRGPDLSQDNAFSGTGSLMSRNYDSDWSAELELNQAQEHDWIRISVQAYFEPDQVPAHRDHCTQFVIELYDETGSRRRYRSMTVTTHIGNEDGSIWSIGKPGMWDEAMFYFRLPGKLDGWRLKAYVRNTNGQEVYIDDVRIDRYVER